jgi:hypothetical protein
VEADLKAWYSMAILAPLLAMIACVPAGAQDRDEAPSVRMKGTETTIPIIVVKEFPFVEAEVNGVQGKLMLDTGAAAALSLNNHRVPLEGGTHQGRASFGSGQTYSIMKHDRIDSVKFHGFRFDAVRNVRSQDATQLESITPDFIGWLGFELFRGYAMKLDYKRNVATFYKDSSTAEKRFLRGERVVAIIPFEQTKLIHVPVVPVRAGSQVFDGAFDTGQFGALWAGGTNIDLLVKEGVLTKRADKPFEDQEDVHVLKGLDLASGAATLDLDVETFAPPFPPAKSMGLRPNGTMTFGYNLLSKYKTVWDYAKRTIYLLEY